MTTIPPTLTYEVRPGPSKNHFRIGFAETIEGQERFRVRATSMTKERAEELRDQFQKGPVWFPL